MAWHVQNVVATYIGVALYIVLYTGYTIYEKFALGKTSHFVSTSKIDFVSDAVWKPGEGENVRTRDREIYEKNVQDLSAGGSVGWAKARIWVKEYVH